MVMQAFVDDSHSVDGVYVLAGAIASVEDWAKFTKEWEKLLPKWGVITKSNPKPHFKYAAMKYHKKENIPVFLNTLEKYITASVVAKINLTELKNAQSRIYIPNRNIIWADLHAFVATFRFLMDSFHTKRPEFTDVLGNDPIDFYFDDESQKSHVIKMWDDYLNSRSPDIKKYYGATPRFGSDDNYLPLQGADLLAGWARECYEENNHFASMKMKGFKRISKHPILHFAVTYDEDQLTKALVQVLRTQISNKDIIYTLPKYIR